MQNGEMGPYTFVVLFDEPNSEWRSWEMLTSHFDEGWVEYLNGRDFAAHSVLPLDYLYNI